MIVCKGKSENETPLPLPRDHLTFLILLSRYTHVFICINSIIPCTRTHIHIYVMCITYITYICYSLAYFKKKKIGMSHLF
uniref:Uncharacterized protein n=1 Tax=Piliocolobus tephrosceles TaxID=591936 RepID=A0A8C9IS77_9PRIM